MQCVVCGAEVPSQATFCPQCGQRVNGGSGASPPLPGEEPTAGERLRHEVAKRTAAQPGSEEVLWEGNYSGRAMIGTWLLVAVLTVALVAGAIYWNETNVWIAVAALGLLAWLVVATIMGYRKASVHYVLRQERLVHEKGILKRVIDRIETIDIDDVTCEQGFVERSLGVGTIRIHSSDRTHPELILPGIRDVQHVAELIDNVRRKERYRRGLHIESI